MHKEDINSILQYSHFVFNSKDVKTGSVFVGLGTGKNNGGIFAQNAINNGAKFLILETEPNFEIEKHKYLVVSSAIEFVTTLARKKFAKLVSNGVKTIAITGSVGKTTTKDLLTFILKKLNKKVFSTQENFNNQIGLPFTILNSPTDIEFLILEMGMNHIGEISHLINTAPTLVRVITNIYNAHVGNFKDEIDGIFKAKSEIIEGSGKETIFISTPKLYNIKNIKDNFIGIFKTTKNLSQYSTNNNQTHFEAYDKKWEISSIVTKEWLSLFLICLEILTVFKIPLNFSIADLKFTKGRGNVLQINQKSILIDESYNANPQSVKNAILKLQLYKNKKKCLVLGSMKELGKKSQIFHKEIFNLASSLNDIDVFFIGQEFNFNQNNWFENVDEFILHNHNQLSNYNITLIKASNSLKFNKITNFLIKNKLKKDI